MQPPPFTPRLRLGLALAIAAIAALSLGVGSAQAASVGFTPAFGSGDLGEATTLSAAFSISGSEYHGSPAPVTEVAVHLPAGVGGSSAGFLTCSLLVLEAAGPSGCPAGSLAGPVGSIGLDMAEETAFHVVERVHVTGTVQPVFANPEETAGEPELLYYLDVPGLSVPELPGLVFFGYDDVDSPPYGRVLTLKVPLVSTIPSEPLVSITNLSLTLGATRTLGGGTVGSLTIPTECPHSSHFAWEGAVAFHEAGAIAHMAETACPTASAKHSTTTTLGASPTAPHVGEAVTYTATVAGGGGTAPSGAVQFFDNGTTMAGCSAQPMTPASGSSTATCQVTYGATGSHDLTAIYSGDTAYLSSIAGSLPVTVSPPETPSTSTGSAGDGSSGSTASPATRTGSTSPPGLSVAQLAGLLTPQLVPSGKAAKIGELLRHGGLAVTFKAPEAGTLAVQWYYLPSGAKLAKQAKVKPVLVASGRQTFSGAGAGKLKLTLTAQGRRLLRHAHKLMLSAKAVFRPQGDPVVSVKRGFQVRR